MNRVEELKNCRWIDGEGCFFCKAVAPYLRVKTEQALLLIALQQTMTNGGKRLPQFVVDERNRLSKMVKELKHVSWD